MCGCSGSTESQLIGWAGKYGPNGELLVAGANWQTKSNSSVINGSFVQNRKRDQRTIYWYLDDLGVSGPYDIYVKWLNPDGQCSSTRYRVDVNEGSYTYVTVQHAGYNVGDWVYFGKFEIKPPSASRQNIVLDGFDNRYGYEGAYLEADTVKLVPTYAPQEYFNFRYIHSDHLATPQFATDESGQIVGSAGWN